MEFDGLGVVDIVSAWGASGWAYVKSAPSEPVVVEAIVRGDVVGRAIVNEMREDLKPEFASGLCGFTLRFHRLIASAEALTFQGSCGAHTFVLQNPNLSNYEGYVDSLDNASAIGWVWRPDAPKAALHVEVLDGAEVIGEAIANEFRPDLQATRRGTGCYGFNFRFVRPARSVDALLVRVGYGESLFVLKHSGAAQTPLAREPSPPAQPTFAEGSAMGPSEPLARYLAGETSDYDVIKASGLFDANWYRESNSDLAEFAIDMVDHFCRNGFKEGRWPNFYFDTPWYRANNLTAEPYIENPLTHYILLGEAGGCQPSVYFWPDWYRKTHQIPLSQSALAHYLRHAALGEVSPVLDFDVAFYLEHNPDIAAAGIDPFRHYITTGYQEGRNPSAALVSRKYIEKHLGGRLDECPLLHFLRNDRNESLLEVDVEKTTTYAREMKYFTAAGPDFQEFKPAPTNRPRRAKALAYYLPQFHTFPENDRWWGPGFTEWTNITRGAPRFGGHYQPRIPRDLGFYSLSDSDVLGRQVAMAKAAGIFGFVFYYYQFGEKRLMEKPLEAFLADPSIDMPFCLMWANENWTRTWDGFERDVLIAQTYSEADDDSLLAHWLRHFADPRYIRIEGRPVLMIYRPGVIPDVRGKIAAWRAKCAAAGEANPLFVMAQGFGDVNPLKFGFDGAIEFPPHKVAADLPPANGDLEILDPDFSGTVFNYEGVVERSIDEPAPDFPLIKAVFPSWDNDARRQGSGMVIHGSSPEKYRNWLDHVIAFSRHNPFFGENFVCINAWNEWAEGAYLEPDQHFGFAYLNATAEAVYGADSSKIDKICLVGHDAHPHGAQLLLKNIAAVLVERFGMEAEIVLLDNGDLTSAYRDIAKTTIARTNEELRETFRRLSRHGYRAVIVNSSASAAAVEFASAANLKVIMLVHELPSIIAEMNLGPAIRKAAPFVSQFVFPAAFVRDAFTRLFDIDAERTALRHQGSYAKIAFSLEDRRRIRALLNIAEDETVVIGIGYADLRKGFDIFVNAWRSARRRGLGVHFVWLGGMEKNIKVYLKGEIDAALASGRFHIASFTNEVSAYYSASDILFLSSREDPFPTVVLEALQSGVPSIAFAETGGIPELIVEHEAGVVAPLADAEAVVDAILSLREKWPTAQRGENRLTQLARETFSFDDYVLDLLRAANANVQTISVVVPNYNYARYLRKRLSSVFGQTYPVYEVIVLDDCSTDDSVRELAGIASELGRGFATVANATNSGSVFRQWRKAAEIAKGDLVWIAEADDDAQPEFLERLARVFANDASVVLAYCDSKAIDENGAVLSDSYKFYYDEVARGAFDAAKVFDGREFIEKYLSERNIIMNVSACLWRRRALLDALEAVGDDLFDFRVAGDWRVYVEALRAEGARVGYEPEPLNVHRRHSGSVTRSALSAVQHVREVEAVQDVVASCVDLDEGQRERQSSYIRHLQAHFELDA